MDKFLFNELTEEDIKKYSENSKIFNITKGELLSTKITLNSFTDETLGSANEKLDMAVKIKGQWVQVDTKRVEEYNEIPIDFMLVGIEGYTDCLIIIRRMSNIILDKVKSNVNSYIYHIAPNKYEWVVKNPVMVGKLARYNVELQDNLQETLETVKSKVDNDYDRESLIKYINGVVQ